MKDHHQLSALCWLLEQRRLDLLAIRVVILGMFALNTDWTLTLAILAVFTMTLGNLAAIMQKSVTRMLAYQVSRRQATS